MNCTKFENLDTDQPFREKLPRGITPVNWSCRTDFVVDWTPLFELSTPKGSTRCEKKRPKFYFAKNIVPSPKTHTPHTYKTKRLNAQLTMRRKNTFGLWS